MDVGAESQLDLRGVPTWEHHAQTCKAFAELHDTETLAVTYDYEPRPLRQRFDEQFAGRYLWSQRRVGDGRWEVALRKLPASTKHDRLADFIERCPVFAEGNAETRATLARIAVQRSIGRHQALSGAGIDWPFLGAVREGRIFAIAETPEGRDQILFEVLSGEIFGDIVMFDRGPTIGRFATFGDPAEYVLFSRTEVAACASRDPDFAFALAASCAQRARGLIELVCAQVAKPTVARVAAALLPHAPVEFGLTPVDPQAVSSLRLGQVAATAGTVKEVVARAFAALEAAGAIKRVRGRIGAIDRAKLANFI